MCVNSFDADLEESGLVPLVVVSTSVLREDSDLLNDWVVEDRVVEWSTDANSLVDATGDQAADVVLGLDEVGER